MNSVPGTHDGGLGTHPLLIGGGEECRVGNMELNSKMSVNSRVALPTRSMHVWQAVWPHLSPYCELGTKRLQKT
jgi:hypothetical protein